MRAKLPIAVALALIATVTACEQEPSTKRPRKTIVTPTALASGSAALPEIRVHKPGDPFDPPEYRDVRARGPAEGNVPRDERVNAVLALVAGGEAGQLPLVDVEPGRTFDADLGKEMEWRPGGGGPRLRTGDTKVEGPGRLPPEVVQRIVRMKFGKLRQCYERELEAEPKREGKVTVAFTITEKGVVVDARDDGSTIGSKDMIKCIVGEMKGLTFPEPQGGSVKVTYPLLFSPPE